MILFEILGGNENNAESHPIYQDLEIANGDRQYAFLKSIVEASLATERSFLSSNILKALNHHAITCLHTNAGEYRPCQVYVGTHTPPEHYRVQALMDDFVNEVNRHWETYDPVFLAAYVLWRINWIHPFINGNGRTARAACYFVLCVSHGAWMNGAPILPELIKNHRPNYVSALNHADSTAKKGTLDLGPLHRMLQWLIIQQLNSSPRTVAP